MRFVQPLIRVRPDVARAYVEARIRGIKVEHFRDFPCRDFDSCNEVVGVFRYIGEVIFDKDSRRWSVAARSDCDASELTSLVKGACWYHDHYGQSPGQGLRRRGWSHFEGRTDLYDRSSPVHRQAALHVAIELDVDDLLTSRQGTEPVPDSIEALAHLVERHYDDLLREAEQA